jgi:hypothetical protein
VSTSVGRLVTSTCSTGPGSLSEICGDRISYGKSDVCRLVAETRLLDPQLIPAARQNVERPAIIGFSARPCFAKCKASPPLMWVAKPDSRPLQ